MARRKAKRTWKREGVKVRERIKGSGVWWVFVNKDGQRASYRKGDRETADAFANELLAGVKLVEARNRGLNLDELQRIGLAQPAPPDPGAGVTFADFAARVLERWEPNPRAPEEGLKFSTWRDYRQCVALRIAPALGHLAVAAIQRRHIREMEDTFHEAKLSATNIRKNLRITSSILSQAAEDELIEVNPMLHGGRKRRRSKAKQTTKRHDPFTHAELAALLHTAETHAVERRGKVVHPFRASLPLLLCLADTGVRLGEAFAFTWGDVDWRSGVLMVRRSFTQGHLDVPKGGKARKVEMTTRLRLALRMTYEARFQRVAALDAEEQAKLDAAQAERAAGALLFPDEDGGYLDDSNLRRRVWAPLLTAAKQRHRRLHDLRHSYATLHLQGGTDPVWVSSQLGHHSVAFTLSTYVHTPKGDRGGHADRITNAPECTGNAPDVAATVSNVA